MHNRLFPNQLECRGIFDSHFQCQEAHHLNRFRHLGTWLKILCMLYIWKNRSKIISLSSSPIC